MYNTCQCRHTLRSCCCNVAAFLPRYTVLMYYSMCHSDFYVIPSHTGLVMTFDWVWPYFFTTWVFYIFHYFCGGGLTLQCNTGTVTVSFGSETPPICAPGLVSRQKGNPHGGRVDWLLPIHQYFSLFLLPPARGLFYVL